MKKFQKISALVLAIVMSAMISLTAFAADNGSITVNNTTAQQKYSVYQLLTLESYDTTANTYSYKATPAFASYIAAATDYFEVDAEGYVSWIDTADVAAFAKDAKNYIAENSIAATQTKTATGTSVSFTGLSLGYYLVDSTLGAVCSLNTTKPDATVNDKNSAPTVTKEVKEDSTSAWGESNTAAIGDTVEFRTTIAAKKGAVNYVLHDKMEAGFTLDASSIAIAGLTAGTDYTVSTSCTDGCTFEIVFAKTYLDSITADTNIVVTYSAVLNESAEISTDSNDNTTNLTYGNKIDVDNDPSTPDEFPETPSDKTETYTFKFDLVKTDADNEVITGAKFKLYDAATDGNEIKVVKVSDGVYRLAVGTETGVEIEAGEATINGLDGDTTYYLQETKQPDGYTILKNRVAVVIDDANLDATVNAGTYASGGVQVINKAGSLLPSTGGIGTTMFYAFGGILVLGAAVLLITKKRTSVTEA
ncbi:MAG: SpaH/EbpB family LPXTG-anchored major pilin [Ruminococcus sp.]|nr:SpaH/EbpB family LPXTG-anchored major pilin [Ruminococcus sp.]